MMLRMFALAAVAAVGAPVWAQTEGAPAAPAPAADVGKMAGPKSLAIFVLSGEKVGAQMTDVYAVVRQGIEAETALEVAPLEVFPSTVRENAIRQCAGDPRCFAGKVREAGVQVDWLLLVSADRLGEGVLLGLRLIDLRLAAANQPPELQAIGEQLPEGVSLLRAIKDYLAQVFPRDVWGQVASLKIEVDQPNAEVLVGQKTCVSPCSFARLAPGDYDVTVRKQGFVDFHKGLKLASRQDEVLNVALTEEEGSLMASPFFWGAVGLGAAAATVLTVVLATAGSGKTTICITSNPELCDQ